MIGLIETALRGAVRLRGYRSRFIETSWGRVHALEAEGKGALPPMVFLHGISASAVDLAPLYEPLRRHAARVVALDLPGHGLSAVPHGGMTARGFFGALSAAYASLVSSAAPALVFGNSLGGMCAVRVAAAEPSRVRALVLSSPGGAGMTAAELREFLQDFPAASRASARDFVGRLYVEPPWYRPLVVEIARRRFARPSLRSLLANVTPEDLIRPDEVGGLVMPVLFVWGRQDRLQPPSQRDWYLRHLPAHAIVEEPDGYGHCPYLERPDELAERVLAFARAVATGQAPAAPAGRQAAG